MLVLDADSVMSGDTIVRLAALMEASPRTAYGQKTASANAPSRLCLLKTLQCPENLAITVP